MATGLQKPCSSPHLSSHFRSPSPFPSPLQPQALRMEEDDDAGAAKKAAVWDCGSSLYDSFELEALNRQLASVIAARSYSMPHRWDPAPPPQRRPASKPSKISRSVHRLLRAVFRVGAGAATPAASPPPPRGCVHMGCGSRGVRPHGGADGVAAAGSGKKGGAVAAAEQLGPAVRKSASERFRGTVPVVSRISCS